MLKQLVIDGYTVLITETNITIMFGAWTYTPWTLGRKKKYNAIEPSKPIDSMTQKELETLAKLGIAAGLTEKEKLNAYFNGLIR